MKKYSVEVYQNLLFTRGAIKGPKRIFTARLLIDTGSSYTILPVEAFISVGYDLALFKDENKIRLTTTSGFTFAHKIVVQWLHLFGIKIENYPVVAYTLPEDIYADGILGMDFLTRINAIIDIKKGIIHLH